MIIEKEDKSDREWTEENHHRINWREFKMSKKVDDTLVLVPVGLLAQIKAMSSFLKYETMSFEKVWDDIGNRCEEVEENLSTSMDIVAQARAIFEFEKKEGAKAAQDLVNELIATMPGDEGKTYMGLVAITLRKLSKKYEEGK